MPTECIKGTVIPLLSPWQLMENCFSDQRKFLHINIKKIQKYKKRIEKFPSEMNPVYG